MLRIKILIWGSGREFVLVSVFFVMRSIIELRKFGCFAVTMIKIRYLPNNVYGDAVNKHFSGNEVGYDDAIYVRG